jgi:hypothetical protein
MPAPVTLTEYYADAHVRARIVEYCGGAADRAPTAVYLSSMSAGDQPFLTWDMAPRRPPAELDALLAAGADIARSAWDTDSLLLHIDLDYQNVDNPGEAYHHPADVFVKIEPAYRASCHVFERHGLRMLPLVTGRGYHFTGRVSLSSPVVDCIAGLAPLPPAWLATTDTRRREWLTPPITERHARAYVGAGLLAEYLAHQILRRARPRSPLPVVMNGTVVGTGDVGRECLSIDLSYAGDPMDVRHMRVAFGAYQKHRFRPDLAGAASAYPPMIAVPRGQESLEHMLSHTRDLRHAARLARSVSAVLPDTTDGVVRLLAAYQPSRLAMFHRAYFSEPIPDDPPALRPGLPRCVTHPLTHPNDLLLQPTILQHVTRVLLADGMAPRDVAALVRAKYQEDHGWGPRWTWMDAATRAAFDVRVFSGLLLTGVDQGIDLNCRSAQEKGICPGGECGLDLRAVRARMLKAVRS